MGQETTCDASWLDLHGSAGFGQAGRGEARDPVQPREPSRHLAADPQAGCGIAGVTAVIEAEARSFQSSLTAGPTSISITNDPS